MLMHFLEQHVVIPIVDVDSDEDRTGRLEGPA
jgi:hypothetical protein